jgi:hypothetical protein
LLNVEKTLADNIKTEQRPTSAPEPIKTPAIPLVQRSTSVSEPILQSSVEEQHEASHKAGKRGRHAGPGNLSLIYYINQTNYFKT